MNNSRLGRARGGLAGALAMMAAVFTPLAGQAADLTVPDNVSLKDAPDVSMHDGGNNHATIPAGVIGAAMVGQGQFMAMYMPMAMGMDGNYIGTNKVSAKTILSTPTNGGMMPYLRVVPENMDAQMHMLGASYGVTDAINVMVMGGYTEKDMSMSTYYKMPMPPSSVMPALIGTRTYTDDGFGDVSVTGLFRLYEDSINHIHLNLGLSLPTGSTTQQMNMLTPGSLTPSYMQMRSTYGMQLGTGTYDLLPGLTYTANKDLWSWGAAYRGRMALDSDQGYHWGDCHQLTGWLGYTFLPGITATGRISGAVQGKIEGMDPKIMGVMQGAYPAYYGGESVDVFGGIEIAGHEFGLGNTRFAIEAGLPVYQDLNGPQIGQDWQVNAVLAVHF